MDDAARLMQILNRTYMSEYRPFGTLIARNNKLFEYSGREKNPCGVWVGLHLGWEDGNLTVEGAQRLSHTAKRKIKVPKSVLESYFFGESIKLEAQDGWHILESGNLYCCAAKIKSNVAIFSLASSRRI